MEPKPIMTMGPVIVPCTGHEFIQTSPVTAPLVPEDLRVFQVNGNSD
jgi:hypothetical protein